MFTSEESSTRNQSISKKSHLNKFDPVPQGGGFASLSTCSPLRASSPRLFANQRFALRLGSSTLSWAQNDRGCTRRLRPLACVRVSGCCAPRAHLRGGRWWTINDGGCTRRLRPLVRKSIDLLSDSGLRPSLGRKTTADVRRGFASSGHSQVSSENLLR